MNTVFRVVMYKLVTRGEGGSRDEFKRRMEVSNPMITSLSEKYFDQVRKYFNLADKDGDGQITKSEWYKVLNDAGVPTTM